MNFSTFRYFLKEGFSNVWINRMMSATSVLVMTCCMIITGAALIISVNINKALKLVEHRNNITVFLENDISKAEVKSIGEKISQVPNIKSCEYFSSGQAAERYKDVLGDLYELVENGSNPFPDAYHVSMHELSEYNDTVKKLESIEGVKSVSDRSETAKKLSDLSKLVYKAGIFVVLVLGAVSIFIISNTIKITMHSRRFEISIMKSVGATNGFIRAPFIVEGMIIGTVSAIISVGIIAFFYNSIFGIVSGILPFHSIRLNDFIYQILWGFLIFGNIFGIMGGVVSIKKYLSKEGGDVVAW